MISRRRFLAGLALLLPADLRAEGDPPSGHHVIVVSRSRILSETKAGKMLREEEVNRSASFQARVEAVREALEAEEQELAALRGRIPREAFDARAKAFDAKVRATRRRSQKQSAELQRTFRRARERLNAALGPILIDVLRETGADIVLDTDQILVAAPSVNMTDRVIRLVDERIPEPEIEPIADEPLLPDNLEAATPAATPD